MVVVQHPKAPKRPKLSLFRLGKSSKQSVDTTTAAVALPPGSSIQNHQVEADTETQNDESNSSQYEFPESQDASPSPPRVSARFSSRRNDSRQRADSLPMERALDLALFSQGPNNSYTSPRPVLHSLSRIQSEAAAFPSHSRQRSHFSIPDVIITTCEEEGNEELVEVRIDPNKRRSYILKTQRGHSAYTKSGRRYNKTGSMFGRKPTPLLHFSESELSMNDPTLARTASPSSISSFASSTLSKSNAAQRLRKASFPNLFGRKSLDSSSCPLSPSSSVPPVPETPLSAPAQSSDFQHPSISDSIESRNSSSSDTMAGSYRPAESAPTSFTKKEQKAKVKEEQALIKELERVNRLVKQHDQKTQKALEKAQAKQEKKAAKLGTSQGHPQVRPSSDAHKSAPKKTVFSATTKASSSAALGRRTSVRHTTAAGTIDPSKRESFKFPRPAPQPKAELQYRSVHPVAVGGPRASTVLDNSDDISPETITPPRPQRLASSELASPEGEAAGNTSDDFETQAWAPSSWSSFEPAFASPLPSLIVTSSSTSSGSSTSSHSLPLSLVSKPSDVFSEDLDVETEEEAARRRRRASVQRILALSDAGTNLLQKQASLRKRRSQTQALKRRSSRLETSSSSERFVDNSGSNAYKRISLGRDMAQTVGWQVVAGQTEVSTHQLQNMDEDWEEDTPRSSLAQEPLSQKTRTPDVVTTALAETPRQRPSVPARAAERPMRTTVVSTATCTPPRRPARRSVVPKSRSSMSSSTSSSSVSTTDLMNGFGLPSAALPESLYESRKLGVLQSNTNATNIPRSIVNCESKKMVVRPPFAPLPHLDLYDPAAST